MHNFSKTKRNNSKAKFLFCKSNPERVLIFQILQNEFYLSSSSKGLSESLRTIQKDFEKSSLFVCFGKQKKNQKGFLEINPSNWHEVNLRTKNKMVSGLNGISFKSGFELESFKRTPNKGKKLMEVPLEGVALCFDQDEDEALKGNEKTLRWSILFYTMSEAMTVGNLLITSRRVGCVYPDVRSRLMGLVNGSSLKMKEKLANSVREFLGRCFKWKLEEFVGIG